MGGVSDPEKQKADYIRILDMHQRNGMNAMIVQVRPAADAFILLNMSPGVNGLRAHRASLLLRTMIPCNL